MKARARFVAVMAVALVSASARAQAPGSIEGKVLDRDGHPVDGAQVTLSPGMQRAISGDDGVFAFPGLKSGAYVLSARRIGFQPGTANVEVRDTVVKITISLTAIPLQLDSIRIREKSSGLRYSAVVLDQNDQPVTGAEVMAAGINNTLVTDSLGRFLVPKLGRGTIMLRLRKIGYEAFFGSYRMVTDRADTLRMPRLSRSLKAVEIRERGGFGSDYWAYRDLDQRTRWKGSMVGVISREELEQQGASNLCNALPRTPSGNRYVFMSLYNCPRTFFNMLIDGVRCERRKLTDFDADKVELVEFYPAGSDISRNLASRRCMGDVFVIWLRKETVPAP
jgi:hypothetical protein